MKTLMDSLRALLGQSFAAMLQYRGEIILWAVWGVVYPAVGIAMWRAVAEGAGPDARIAEYDGRGFAAYFLLTMIVGHMCTAWDVYEMGSLVRSGKMSPKLLRPILPIWSALTDNIAFKALTSVVLVPVWILVALLVEPRFEGNVVSLLLGVIAVVLASLNSFVWGYVASTLAFWFTKMDAVSELWMGAGLLLGGRLGPLTVLPTIIQSAAAYLPFKWIVWFPSAALIGKIAAPEIAWGLLWQVGWLVAGVVAFRFMWSVGVKRFTAVGG